MFSCPFKPGQLLQVEGPDGAWEKMTVVEVRSGAPLSGKKPGVYLRAHAHDANWVERISFSVWHGLRICTLSEPKS
ncbi:MAG: hypothetical protein CMO80_04210 [Verrucomicrobiales bacterium]|nr:hypothetical protein [Verrucomicrobiales bacterium]